MSMDASLAQRQIDTWVVIPVYNNAATLRRVAIACRQVLPHVLMVDDGSRDADVRALLADTDIVVLTHPRNLGKGRAIRTGLEHVRRAGGQFMITLDADGQHFPEDLTLMLPLLRPDTIVIGARETWLSAVPAVSRFGRRFSDFWVWIETGVPVNDTQSGFRGYPVAHLQRLPLSCRRYDFEVEVLVRALWAGLRVRIVPIHIYYAPRDERVSSFRPFVDNARLSRLHTRLIGRRLLPVPPRRLVTRRLSCRTLMRRPRRLFAVLLRENASPRGLAVSAGVGMFLGTLPLIGLHVAAVAYVAICFRLNKLMALAVQNLCIPPVVPGVCIAVGYFLRHGHIITEATLRELAGALHERLWEWFLGSLIVAPLLAVLTAIVVYALASWARRRSARARRAPA